MRKINCLRNAAVLLLSFVMIFNPMFGGQMSVANAAIQNTYYVDAENGNDANDGLSESKAWKTIEKVKRTQFVSGNTILFHRGQTWYDAGLTPNCDGLTFGAYGEGERPVLSGAVPVSGWELYGSTGTIYNIPAPAAETPYLIKIGDQLFRRSQPASIAELPGNKFMWDANGGIYLNSPSGDPDTLGTTYIQKAYHIFYIYDKRNITVKDLNLTMTGGGGVNIQSGKSSNIKILNNEISFAESANYSDGSGINASGTSNSQFSNNIIHDVFGDGILLWNCSGITVSDNNVSRIMKGVNPGGDGIQCSGKSGNAAPNNKIMNNIISMEGSDTPKGCIQQENGDNAVISGNTCYYGYFGIESNSNNGLIENNFVAYQGYVPSPVNWSAGLYMSENEDLTGMTWRNNIVYKSKPYGFKIGQENMTDDYGNPLPLNVRGNFHIYNNTIYSNGTPFASLNPLSGEIRNNIFWNMGSSDNSVTAKYVVDGGTLKSDHNIFGPQKSGFISWLGNNYDTIWMFRNITTNDLHSRISEPLFSGVTAQTSTTPIKSDFRLFSNSPGVGDGGEIKDAAGQTIYSEGCQIGALQETVQSSQPPIVEPDEPLRSAPPAFQQGLLVYEGFDYYPTSQLINAGSSSYGWGGPWTEVVAENLKPKIGTSGMSYNNIYDTGYKAMFASTLQRNFQNPVGETNGNYWVSFLVTNDTGRGFTATLFNKDGSTGGIILRKQYQSAWEIKMRTKWKTSTIINSGQSLVLMKLSITDTKTTASLWINPDLANGESGLGNPHLTEYADQKITPSSFQMSISTGSTSFAEIDEIRIATNFSAVTNETVTIPEKYGAGGEALLNGQKVSGMIIPFDRLPQKVTGRTVLYNNTPIPSDRTALLAVIVKKDDKLVRMSCKPVSMPEGSIKEELLDLNLQNLEPDDYTIQFMVWDSIGVMPFIDPKIIRVIN